jgi:hypothetical protein
MRQLKPRPDRNRQRYGSPCSDAGCPFWFDRLHRDDSSLWPLACLGAMLHPRSVIGHPGAAYLAVRGRRGSVPDLLNDWAAAQVHRKIGSRSSSVENVAAQKHDRVSLINRHYGPPGRECVRFVCNRAPHHHVGISNIPYQHWRGGRFHRPLGWIGVDGALALLPNWTFVKASGIRIVAN